MKKLISMFLAFAMIFSTVYVSFAEEDIIVENEFASAAGLLNAMDITEVDVADADKPVSRKEFVKALYKLITNADYALENAMLIAKDYPPQMRDLVVAINAANFVSSTVALMVMDILYEDGTFAPLTEQEKVTSNLLMFCDRLPE